MKFTTLLLIATANAIKLSHKVRQDGAKVKPVQPAVQHEEPTEAEMAAYLDSDFKVFDKNNDGKITEKEAEAQLPKFCDEHENIGQLNQANCIKVLSQKFGEFVGADNMIDMKEFKALATSLGGQ